MGACSRCGVENEGRMHTAETCIAALHGGVKVKAARIAKLEADVHFWKERAARFELEASDLRKENAQMLADARREAAIEGAASALEGAAAKADDDTDEMDFFRGIVTTEELRERAAAIREGKADA